MGKIYDSIGINQREIEQNSKQIRKLEKELKKNLSQAKVIVPFTMYGGFKDFSEIGELGTLNKINDQSSYQRVFTGKSSVVAIWDNSVKLVNKPKTAVTEVVETPQFDWLTPDDSSVIQAPGAVRILALAHASRDTGFHMSLSKDNYVLNQHNMAFADIPDAAHVVFNLGASLFKADGATPVTWADIKDKLANTVFAITPDDTSTFHASYTLNSEHAYNKNELVKEYSLGDYMVGISFSTNLSSNVDNFSDGKDFTEMHDTETMTMVVPAQNFSEADMYKVYVIPQETQRWLRITDINRIKDTEGNVVFAELTFTSVNDIIENTGLSKYNYIQRAAIGENYAWPKVDNDAISFEVLGGEGVNEYQIEFLGNTLVHGIGFIGRDADKRVIEEPKWLLTSDMLAPIESQVKRVSAPENNLLLLRDCKFTEKTYFKKWKDEMSQGYDATIRKQYEGMIAFDNKLTQLNKEVGDKNIWDNTINFDLSGGAIEYDGSASPYVRAKYSVTSETVPGLLNRNLLSHSWITQLPQEIDETIAWRAADIPVVGKLVGLFTSGIPFGWKHSSTVLKTKGLNFLGSRAQALMYSTAIFAVDTTTSGTEIGLLPSEAFDNTEENPIGKITASKSVSIVMRGKLTDTITTDGTDFDTESMKKSSNTYIATTTPKTVNNKYWYIDKHVINSIGKCDYIVTYFRDGVRVWSSRYQTTSKWTDNIRDWLNFASYSPWVEFEADQNGVNWNHIEDLPDPAGSSVYVSKTFVASQETKDNVDLISGNTPRHHYTREIKWQISKVEWARYDHVTIPGVTKFRFVNKDTLKAANGENIHNFTPNTHLFPVVSFSFDDSDPLFINIKITYTGNTQLAMSENEYNAFLNALGDQLKELTLYNA